MTIANICIFTIIVTTCVLITIKLFNTFFQWFKNFNMFKILPKKINFLSLFCKHSKWNSDTQIRTIECIKCGKRAWVNDYVNLYKK